MTVTPPDAELARYTIQSALRCLSEEIHLVIFFNGCHPDLARDILADLPESPYCFQASNWQKIISLAADYGKQIGAPTADHDYFEYREGFYETCGEAWSRELLRLSNYDYVGLLDADLEILEPDLLSELSRKLDSESTLGFVSTDYSPSARVFEPYAGEDCYLMERYHTWCCLYRHHCLQLHGNFGYYEDRSGELVKKYDHAARLQHQLQQLGYRGAALEGRQSAYLHYGAFAKNRSLRDEQLRLYRLLRIGIHNGFRHAVNAGESNQRLQLLCQELFARCGFATCDEERQQYISLEDHFRLGFAQHARTDMSMPSDHQPGSWPGTEPMPRER